MLCICWFWALSSFPLLFLTFPSRRLQINTPRIPSQMHKNVCPFYKLRPTGLYLYGHTRWAKSAHHSEAVISSSDTESLAEFTCVSDSVVIHVTYWNQWIKHNNLQKNNPYRGQFVESELLHDTTSLFWTIKDTKIQGLSCFGSHPRSIITSELTEFKVYLMSSVQP